MKLVIHGRNLEITAAIQNYTELKIERAIHHFKDMVQEADIHLSVAKNKRIAKQTAEVTIFASGTIIRAQEQSENLYASIDLVANKLCRQLRRYKERHGHGHSKSTSIEESSLIDSLIKGKEVQLPEPGIRRKYFNMKEMSVDEARHQLELLDHDFYMFREESTRELQVIYKRKHGGFGLIQAKD
tara:strand:+ start:1617 stop:2171 length:555 start_codon:yes stop_codon:yes gene_type:complete